MATTRLPKLPQLRHTCVRPEAARDRANAAARVGLDEEWVLRQLKRNVIMGQRKRRARNMVENARGKQRGGFRKGQSGNPAGKPKGTRHRATQMAEKLLEDGVEETVKAVLLAARGGDMVAARLVLDRLCPPRRGRPVPLALPAIGGAADVAAAMSAVVHAMTEGEIAPEEASIITGVIEAKRRSIETVELDSRVKALEEARGLS